MFWGLSPLDCCSPLQLSSFGSLLLRSIAPAAIVLTDNHTPFSEAG
jgi:hypothetical protein